MGTSGAFGGSSTTSWKEVADLLQDLGDQWPDAADATQDDNTSTDDDHEQDEVVPKPISELAALIAQALQDDDPAAKPRYAPAAASGDSGLSLGHLVGKPRWRGTSNTAGATGRRRIIASAGRAGRAIGAGYALATANAAALAAFGFDLQTLSGLNRFDQIFAIVEGVGAGNAGPDDIALQWALADALGTVLDVGEAAPPPEETLRDMLSLYARRLFEVELDALIQRGRFPMTERDRCVSQLGDVIAMRATSLNLSGAQLITPQQFEHAAQQIMRATLAIVASEGA